MTTGATAWSELDLTPDPAIADSQIFHRLKATHLERVDEQDKNYGLICDKTGLKFEVQLTGILSEYRDDLDPYRPGEVLADLHRVLDSEGGSALSEFFRYSPWLIADLNVKDGGLSSVQRGVMLARLLELFVVALEDRDLTDGRFQDAYVLLLRARFVVLARLHEVCHEDVEKYLPDVEFQVREAWRAWGRSLFLAPQEMELLLDRYGRRADEEGARLIFADEHKRALWSFAITDPDLPFTRQLLSRWFLPRYDVPRVMRVLGRISGRFLALRQALPIMQFVVSVVAVVGLSSPLVLGAFVSSDGVVWRVLGDFANLMSWLAVLLAAGAILMAILLDFDPLRYSLPRITSAIFVGYIALVSSGELMTFAIRAYDHDPPLVALTTAIGTTFFAFMAIYIDARRRLDDWRTAAGRAGLVLLIAAARSLTLGWLILAPAGGLLLSETKAINDARSWTGILGFEIYPQLIFILAPLALFIGIFVQTIWEEYPLTHPI